MTENFNDQSKKSRFGPHGLGDPNDHTLRKMEVNVLIPQYRREIVKKEKCSKIIDDYQNCVEKNGLIGASLYCRTEKIELTDCLEYWNDDEEISARAKKEYLEERSEYRRTGISKANKQVFEKYLEEKQKEEEQNNKLS